MTHYIARCTSDYHSYVRHVYVDKRLDRMPFAQAGVITRKGVTQLVSYETIVAEIDDGWLHVYGLFSNTTRKHIGAFLKEYAPRLFYADARACYENDVEINIETRETRDAALCQAHTIGLRHAI